MRHETMCKCGRRKRVKALLCRACVADLPPIISFPAHHRDPRVKLRACRSAEEHREFRLYAAA